MQQEAIIVQHGGGLGDGGKSGDEKQWLCRMFWR